MKTEETSAVIRLLVDRGPFVTCLEREPRTKGELVAATGVSRSTVDRAVADLVDGGLVSRVSGRFALTMFGRVVVRRFAQARDELEALLELREFLDSLDEAADLDPVLLQGATTRTVPAFPALVATELVAGDHDMRVLSPVLPLLCAVVETVAPDAGRHLELVVEADLEDQLRSFYADEVTALVEAGVLTLYTIEEPLPFSLVISGDGDAAETLVVTGHGSDTLGILRNRDAAAVEWATETYEAVRDAAGAELASIVGPPE